MQLKSKTVMTFVAGIVLALLLPTPIFIIVAGSWLGWKGVKRFNNQPPKSDSSSADKLP